ncbi:MAG: DUF1501 domain-containing protein [Myxococcota bacterium]|nr:Tat pathway signal protein [Myxococcales bacterium]MEC7750529.1 DUF1501 domain-containing protein [Myxococcota bacterium]|tara:strand:+ start:467 stop:1732 length:1266 start_codon:yes stop_codon:yes gene_type:complete
MDRREFLKLTGIAGLGLVTPMIPRSAWATAAAGEPYSGTFWVFVQATGGWDPTSLCDPKGNRGEVDSDPMNKAYHHDDIQTAGPIHYAPVGYNDTFFSKYQNQLLVLNGVDMQTNGHDSGRRHAFSGSLKELQPCLPALLAHAAAPSAALSFISNGGYDHTAGLVAPTRVDDTGSLTNLAYPDRIQPGSTTDTWHSEATHARLNKAISDRQARQLAKVTLPIEERAMNALFTARSGRNELKRLTEFLPAELDPVRMKRQAQVAVASYKAGITVAATITQGGFDTHNNHDQSHIPRLASLLEGVDFLVEEAERQGIADQMVVMVGSDFGRTPGYNENNGKDHWSVGSMLLMGKGIRGGRVLGATTERHRPLTVNPQTLELDENGIRLKPAHVHRAIHRAAGITELEALRRHPVDGENLDLLT